MLDHCIYNVLNHILPSTDKSENGNPLSLQYMSACKVMENDNNDMIKLASHIPAALYEILFQSTIYKYYLEFINIDEFDPYDYPIERFEYPDTITDFLCAKWIEFPESLGTLILNWPHEELILRNKIPHLHPPIEIFPYHCERRYRHMEFRELANITEWIGLEERMSDTFQYFCSRLIEFLMKTIFKCSPTNNPGYVCHLRILDVSGLGSFYCKSHLSSEFVRIFSQPPDGILEGIRNSTIDTFGHKIDIFVDADLTGECIGEMSDFNHLSNIIKESLKPNVGISVNLKTVTALHIYMLSNIPFPKDFYEVLSLGRCEYIQLWGNDVDETSAANLHVHFPQLLGISLANTKNIGSWNFLRSFEHLEQISCLGNTNDGLINSISNMSKGLKYLDLTKCLLRSKDLECLAKSKHSETLLQLNLTFIKIRNDSEAVGLVTLCQNLKSVKVLILDNCSLDTLSSDTVSKLASAFKDCDPLEFLSMNNNPFSLAISHMIVDDLAYKNSLRYLSLNLPGLNRDNLEEFDFEIDNKNVDMEYVENLCETSHEKINKFRESPIYISWVFVDSS